MEKDNDRKLSPRAKRVEQLDRKLGILWSRFWALVVGSAAVALLAWYFTSAESTPVDSTIFITVIGVGLLLVARHLWRNKDDLSAILDDLDEPVRKSQKPPE